MTQCLWCHSCCWHEKRERAESSDRTRAISNLKRVGCRTPKSRKAAVSGLPDHLLIKTPPPSPHKTTGASILTFKWLLKKGPVCEWYVHRPLSLPCCTRTRLHLVLVLPLEWATLSLFQATFRDTWACVSVPALQTLHRCKSASRQSLLLCLCGWFLLTLAVSKGCVSTHFAPAVSQDKNWQCWLLCEDALGSATVFNED